MALRFVIAGLLAVAASTAGVWTQEPTSYRVVTTDGIRTLPLHASSGTVDVVTLDAAAKLFGLNVRDDPRAGGVVVSAGENRVVLTAGESTVSSSGRLISLSGPVTRSGSTWLVPVDFLRALNRGIEVRRGPHLIVVAPAVVPRITPRFERTATGGRLVLTLDPGVTTKVSREGQIVAVRLQANALDMELFSGAPEDLIASMRTDQASLFIQLGSAVVNVRSDDSRDPTRVTIDLVGSATQAPPSPTPSPVIQLDRPTGIRTVAIDAGHGGDDAGVRASDVVEKDVTMIVALRVKALLEARLGVRVILTREGDAVVTPDRRAALANNNKADLFVSLHANGSPLPGLRGAQVLSLAGGEYAGVEGAEPQTDVSNVSVAVVGGGTRMMDLVPWQLAQLPHVDASARFAAITAQRLADAGVPMHPRPVDVGSLRMLIGANMPAILIELGVLTNPEDATALADAGHLSMLAEAIATAIADVRLGIPALHDGGTR